MILEILTFLSSVILEVVNLLLLLVSLFIIGEVIKNLHKKKKKSMPSLLFLHSETFIKGLRIIFLGITIWIFKDGVYSIGKIISLSGNLEFLFFSLILSRILGIIGAVVLSYGLFLIVFPIKKIFQEKKTNR